MRLPSDLDGLLFDMDGVLVDSEQQWKRLSKEHFEKHMPGWGEADFKRIVGLGPDDLFNLLKTEYGLKQTKAECYADWEKIAVRVYEREVALAAGLKEFLSDVVGRGVPTAIVSSSPHRWIKLVVQRFDLSGMFREFVSADDNKGVGKPDPGVYRLAIAKLGIEPERSVAIEDSEHGLSAAKGAGLRVVGYRNGFNGDQNLSRADWEVSSFTDLQRPSAAR